MNFPNKLKKSLKSIFLSKKAKGLPVSEKENLAKYLFGKLGKKPKELYTDGRVKGVAFRPPRKNLSLSVYRTDELSENEIWEIGDKYVGKARGKDITARANLVTKDILSEGLWVESAPDPHPLHSNIIGWPAEPEKQNHIADQLALKASSTRR